MKQLIVIASTLFLVLSATTVMAKGNQGGNRQGNPGNGNRGVQMQQMLGLSDGQMTQMREIRRNGGSREDMHSVFTNEQRATMEKYRSQNRSQGKGYGYGRGRGYQQGYGNQPVDPDGGSDQ